MFRRIADGKLVVLAALLALAAMLVSGAAMAREYSREHLFSTVSVAGESRDDFAARIAPMLREYSDATGFEACGVIATDGELFGAEIGTSGSHIGCAVFNNVMPAGMQSTGVTIHSHGSNGHFRVNAADRLFIPEAFAHRRVLPSQRLDQFSKLDLLSPGYLATQTGVIFQPGS